eukprot:g4533.t1
MSHGSSTNMENIDKPQEPTEVPRAEDKIDSTREEAKNTTSRDTGNVGATAVEVAPQVSARSSSPPSRLGLPHAFDQDLGGRSTGGQYRSAIQGGVGHGSSSGGGADSAAPAVPEMQTIPQYAASSLPIRSSNANWTSANMPSMNAATSQLHQRDAFEQRRQFLRTGYGTQLHPYTMPFMQPNNNRFISPAMGVGGHIPVGVCVKPSGAKSAKFASPPKLMHRMVNPHAPMPYSSMIASHSQSLAANGDKSNLKKHTLRRHMAELVGIKTDESKKDKKRKPYNRWQPLSESEKAKRKAEIANSSLSLSVLTNKRLIEAVEKKRKELAANKKNLNDKSNAKTGEKSESLGDN